MGEIKWKRSGEDELKWLNNIFKKDNSANSASRLALSDLDAWLDQRAENPEFEKKINDIYSKIGYVAVDLAADIKALRCASPKESAPSRLLNAGLAAKEALIVQMKGISEKLVPPPATDVSSAAEYHSRIVKGLGNTVLKFGTAQNYVAALFPDQAEKLKSDLNRTSHLLVELNETVNKRQSELLDINASKRLGDEVVDKVRQIGELKKKLQDSEKKLVDLQDLETKAQSDLKVLESSEIGSRTKALKESLDIKLIELTKTETEMAELVFPLTKALSRLVKQDSSDRLELKNRRAFELLISSSQEVLDRDISETLLELRSKVDLLGLKDKKREKIVEHLDRLIEDKPLETLKAKHSLISEVAKGLSEKLFESSQEMTKLEETLKQTSQQIEMTKASIDQNMKSLSTMEELVSICETNLKAMLERIAGRPMVLEWES
jgi:peptidoglycan hydrolase CwlO-like protein